MEIKEVIKELERLSFNEWLYCVTTFNALEEAIDALEKHIPKEPTLKQHQAHCGICGYELKEGENWECCPVCQNVINWAKLCL